MSTPLSDPNNVVMVPVEDGGGFTDDEVRRILNGQPPGNVVASVAFEANEDKYDGGGMVALIPSDTDLDRLTLEGEEPRADLHLTLWYLGDDPLTDEQREDVLREVAHWVDEYGTGPVNANAFGFALWNPTSDKPAWVLNVGDVGDKPQLAQLRSEVGSAIAQDFVLPPQHTPWQPHICIAYSPHNKSTALRNRTGPVTFDKIRVAFGRDVYDFELTEPNIDDFIVTGDDFKSGNKNNLKDYWTKGEGLAKWVDHAHPWTELYNHLKKHMPNEMAKRVASEWYHEVKGHWPGEKQGKK